MHVGEPLAYYYDDIQWRKWKGRARYQVKAVIRQVCSVVRPYLSDADREGKDSCWDLKWKSHCIAPLTCCYHTNVCLTTFCIHLVIASLNRVPTCDNTDCSLLFPAFQHLSSTGRFKLWLAPDWKKIWVTDATWVVSANIYLLSDRNSTWAFHFNSCNLADIYVIVCELVDAVCWSMNKGR